MMMMTLVIVTCVEGLARIVKIIVGVIIVKIIIGTIIEKKIGVILVKIIIGVIIKTRR